MRLEPIKPKERKGGGGGASFLFFFCGRRAISKVVKYKSGGKKEKEKRGKSVSSAHPKYPTRTESPAFAAAAAV